MTVAIFALLVLAAISLGLRTTSVVIRRKVHPVIHLGLSLLIGGVMTSALLELCRRHNVFELGLGLLASLAPVGLFDVVKWWFRRKK